MSAAPFDPDQPATYARYSEDTPDGGKIVLVRYPEGYRLRFNGEVVWREGDAVFPQEITVKLSAAVDDEIIAMIREKADEGYRRGSFARSFRG